MTVSADEYWERKYARRSWNPGNDIHFAIPAGNGIDSSSFERGIAQSDDEVLRAVSKTIGVWALLRGLRVLEIGCGTCSLALSLLGIYPLARYVGIDIAANAIADAEKRFLQAGVDPWRYKLLERDVRDTSQLLGDLAKLAPFDLILLRECTYLLSKGQQLALVSALHTVAASHGRLHLQDVQCQPDALKRAKQLLSERQGGGMPFVDGPSSSDAWNMTDLLTVSGWGCIEVETLEDDRVGFSYAAMAALSQDTDESSFYEEISQLATARRISYAMATAERAPTIERRGRGRSRQIQVCSKGRPASRLFRFDSIEFDLGRWHLLVGSSGSGKTTLLEAIVGSTAMGLTSNGVPDSLFIVRTEPPIIEGATVLEHLRLYSSSLTGVTSVATRLGLTDKVCKRLAKNVSSGERQRMSLGQALLAGAEVVLMDEPTQHLDPLARSDFYAALRTIRSTKSGCEFSTVIWIDHAADLPQDLFDSVHELRGGRLEQQR